MHRISVTYAGQTHSVPPETLHAQTTIVPPLIVTRLPMSGLKFLSFPSAGCQVNANLMLAAGERFALDERGIREHLYWPQRPRGTKRETEPRGLRCAGDRGSILLATGGAHAPAKVDFRDSGHTAIAGARARDLQSRSLTRPRSSEAARLLLAKADDATRTPSSTSLSSAALCVE